MKKAIAILLAVCMLFAFAACGDKEKATPADAQVSDNQAGDTTSPDTTEAEKNEPEKMEPVVLLDNEYLTLTINETYIDEDDCYTLKATFENNGEKNYTYYIETSSINGISVMNYCYADVNAGKKAIEEINFEDSLLRNNGVGDYTDIEMTIQIGSEDELFEEPVAEYTVHYYPLGEDKATKYERQPAATDKLLLDNEYVTVTAIGFTHDEDWETTDLNLFIVNKTEDNIALGADACVVNDIMIETYYAEEIPAGKVAFSCLSFDDEELKDKYIEEIESVEIELAALGETNILDFIGNIDLENISEEDISSILGGDGLGFLETMYLFEETVVYEP